MHKSYNAFSLVELSIVLIIIGLLVTGVTGGNKLIQDARIKGIIAEIQAVQQANYTFRLEYSDLPGDMVGAYDFFSSQNCGGGTQSLCDGNGNKQLHANGSGGYYREEHNFWNHLFFSKIFTNVIPTNKTVYYSTKIKEVTIAVKDSTTFSSGNEYRIGAQRTNLTDAETYMNEGRVFSPHQAQTIDKRIDDGIANKGLVRGYNAYDNASVLSTTCLSGSNYNLQTRTQECYLRVRLETPN